jgi:hypothetical protein
MDFPASLRKKKLYILPLEFITGLPWRLKREKRIIGLGFIQRTL